MVDAEEQCRASGEEDSDLVYRIVGWVERSVFLEW